MNQTDKIVDAFSVYHDFWLFRQTERSYSDCQGLAGRKDAPVRLSDDMFGCLEQTLQWVPTLNPGRRCEPSYGLHRYGVTVIPPAGGECFRQLCLGWAQILAQGPEPLIFTNGWTSIEGQEPASWKPYRFRTSRAGLLLAMRQLAEYGEQVAAGEYYLLHMGI